MDRASPALPERRERRLGEPDRRALAAMESAANRARQSGDDAGWTDGSEETGARRLVARTTTSGRSSHAPNVAHTPPRREPEIRRTTVTFPRGDVDGPGRRTSRATWGLERGGPDNRRLRRALVIATIGILGLAVIGLAVGLALRSQPSTSSKNPSGTTQVGRTGAGSHPAATGHTTGSTSGTKSGSSGSAPHTAPQSPTSTPSTTASPAPRGGPSLASASPDAGAPGDTVVVHGSGLFSSNGRVIAYFDGADAPTSCPSQTTCRVIVPDLGPRSSTLHLTIVTSSGRTNALTFAYR
ncbi:MAG TPA: IPT/TIG domain-containing protein [Acidimicrobiales bacterium]|nr:IPT/TIG domain-containing protein [Acidimicrobiales bacterium]